MNQEYYVIVKGRVQGVSFRALTQKRANHFGLCGYVKNLQDQSVAICLQGDPKTIELFLNSLKEDSGLATIETITTQIRKPQNQFSSFSILR